MRAGSSTMYLIPKIRQPRMPHAIRVATRMPHIHWVSCWPPWTVTGRGWHRQFFNDLGLALAPKMVPDQSQAFEEVNYSQAFTVGWKKGPIFFSERAASRCSKERLHKFSRKYSKSWLRRCAGTILSRMQRPKSKIDQNQEISMPCRGFGTSTHESPSVRAVFGEALEFAHRRA